MHDRITLWCLKGDTGIRVEMEDPFTRMSQNFFSFLSQIKQRGYVITTTQALSFSFFPPFSTTVVCVWSTVLLEFPNHLKEFPNLPTPMTGAQLFILDLGPYEESLLVKLIVRNGELKKCNSALTWNVAALLQEERHWVRGGLYRRNGVA